MRKFVIAGIVLLSLVAIISAASLGMIETQDKKMEILVISPPNISAEEISKRLTIDKRGSYVFEYKQGYLKYISSEAFECNDAKLSDKDYRCLAEKYLSELRIEPKLSYEFSGIAEDGKIFAYRNGTAKKCITNRHVNFQLYYNGIKLFGPGAKVRVYFSGDDVAGVITQLWDVKVVGKAKVLDREEVIKKLNDECGSIGSIELAYFVPLPEDGRTYIYPAYVVECVQNGVSVGKIVPAVSMSELKEVVGGES
jgi:hypothetical protein